MSFIKSTIKLFFLIFLAGCNLPNPQSPQNNIQEDTKSDISGNFIISGAYALYPLVSKWAEAFMEINPGVNIEVVKSGTGLGIADLLAKRSHLAMISRPLYDEEITAGIWLVPVAKDGVAPIVNGRNPYLKKLLREGLSPDEYLKVYTNDKPLTWGELLDTTGKEKIIVFTRADESGAGDVFAEFIYKQTSDLQGIKVTGDEEMIKSVQENIYAIGFCNFSYAFDSKTGERTEDIQIIPSDLDFDNIIDRKEIPFSNMEDAHRGLWLGIYPKKLCRDLTLGSLEKPTSPAIIEFLRYVLSQGQQDVKNSGLCELNSVYIKNALNSLK